MLIRFCWWSSRSDLLQGYFISIIRGQYRMHLCIGQLHWIQIIRSKFISSRNIVWSWKLGQKQKSDKILQNWCQDLREINNRLPSRFIYDKTVETVEVVKVWTFSFSPRQLWNIKGMNFGRISSKIPKNFPQIKHFLSKLRNFRKQRDQRYRITKRQY